MMNSYKAYRGPLFGWIERKLKTQKGTKEKIGIVVSGRALGQRQYECRPAESRIWSIFELVQDFRSMIKPPFAIVMCPWH